ncbi:MAG: DUF5309 family protein [Phycisphaeraceae bacterium]|nr:DUF5309 family protein [Phycisphaeraceae bacterium]MCB9847011.1 DUF5309 family protein [Phycisphaeraceae bacterium]
MAFTGKATYGAGSSLPEIAEDVSDIVGIVSPFETPLLDHLGDARRAAKSTVHEWVEDTLLPNTDAVNQSTFSPDATTDTTFTVDNGDRFRVGDLVRGEGLKEVMLVTAVSGDDLTVTRSYGGTTGEALADNLKLIILGNAAIEGADRPETRFTNRTRMRKYTQIFTASVEVSGSQQAVQSIGVADELDYQKQERLRELLRDLENCVINGVAASSEPQGTSTVRRTMNGVLHSVQTNAFVTGIGGFPTGGGVSENELSEEQLNTAMKLIWESSSGSVHTIVVNGFQKRKINAFVGDKRGYSPRDTNFRDLVSVYESDYGVARVVLSRWVPADTVLLLDSTRIDVLPLDGRSFAFKPLASSGDSEVGQLIGEYTLEMRNESAHGLITGLASS